MPVIILPRYIRVTDAPAYLAMCKDVFARDIRPFLTVIPIGERGKAFDRLDLDVIADEYKRRNGRPGKNQNGGLEWEPQEQRESPLKMTAPEPSTRSGKAKEYSPGLEKSRKKKPNNGSRMKSQEGNPSGIVADVMNLCSQLEQKSTLSSAKVKHQRR